MPFGVSIAVDAGGQHVVIGYNDTRGFTENPISLSGVLYSEDGGRTFVDGGRLPSPGNDVIGATRLPQVFGDPEVKYLGGCTFVYSSILIAKFSDTTAVQTMGLHRSIDCGKTWQGPFVITAASNPNGIVEDDELADAADKEFMDVDPDTGRLIVDQSIDKSGDLSEVSYTFSDDGGAVVQPERRDCGGFGVRDARLRCLHGYGVRSELPDPGVRRIDAAHLRCDAGSHCAVRARGSVRAGNSHGVQHVHMRLPGMAGTVAQLRFEFTQDGSTTCLDVGGGPVCGVSIDNLFMRSVHATAAPVSPSSN